MPSEDELKAAFLDLVNAVRGLQKVPIESFAGRLHNKARYNENVRTLHSFFEGAPDYNPLDEEDSYSQELDGRDATDLLARLSIACVGRGTIQVDPSKDHNNYKHYIYTDNAIARFGEIITYLTSFCFVEHIGAELKRLGLPSIKDLTSMEGFADYAIETMSTNRWISQEISVDLWRGDHLFTLGMLLIADFLKSDPTLIPAYGSRFQDRPSFGILQEWSYNIWDDDSKGDAAKVDTMVEFLGNVATIVYVPQTDAQMAQPLPTFDVMREFYSSVIDSRRRRRGGDDDYTEEIRSSLERLDNRQDAINEWKSYCESMASYYNVNMQPKWDRGVVTVFDNQEWSKFYTWMNLTFAKEWDYYWDVEDIKIIPDQPLFFKTGHIGCPLVAGTSILLADGEECLVEKLMAKGRLHGGFNNPKDEAIRESSTSCVVCRSNVALVGFNGEAPFATPGQVFLTSTGLRAVDPKAALAVNPFWQVGQLAPGHVLYRRHGEGYDHVEIKSIEKTKSEERTVYSVFHAVSQEYYHANGYVVSQNVPEHTLQQAVDALRQIPDDKRLSLLSAFKDLSGTFGKYDLKSIKARLDLELFQGYPVPEIQDWGSLTMETMKVDGAVRHATSAPPAKSKPKKRAVPLDQLRRKYGLAAHDPDRMPDGYRLPTIDVIDGFMVVDGEVQLASSHDPDARIFKWTREIAGTKTFEHGTLRIFPDGLSGQGTVFVTSESSPARLSKDSIFTFKAQARSASEEQGQGNALDSGRGYVGLDKYQLTVDRTEWPADTDQDDIRDPIDLGEFTYGYSDEGDGANIPYIQFPLLNQLQDSINSKFNKELDELYRIELETLQDNTFRATVRFHRASTVPLISDSGEDVRTFDVKFPELGLDLTLPVLFQGFYVDLDIFNDYSYGALYEFDPEMRGGKGKRHMLKAEYVGDADYFRQLRTRVSRAFGDVQDPSKRTSDWHRPSPCGITDELIQYREPDVQILMTFPSYREEMVHSTVQTLIQDMMYYHMDDEDRKKFTNRSKPDNLPSVLADNLPAKLKTFFHDKYAPAFLCRSIYSFDKYTSKFTPKERKKLWYWWEGNGEHCLSRSQEYNDLNNIASIEAMKMLYNTDLEPFLESSQGPEHWANELFTKLGGKRIMNQLLTQPIQAGGNAINRECVLMNTLAPSKDFADQWFEKIVAYAGEIGLDYPYIEDDIELAGQWLHDSIHDLIVKVLMDDPSITGSVKEALLEDIEEFEKANNLDQTETAERRAANMIAKQAVFIAEAKNWFTAVGKGLSKALGATRLYQWLGTAFDQVAKKVSGKLPGTKFLKGLSTLCMAAFYIGQLASNIMGLIQNWDLLEPDQRATVILETLKIATDGVGYAIDSFKKFKDNPITSAADQLDVEGLNQGTYRAMGENAPDLGKMSEDINGPGGFHESVSEHVGAADQTPTRPKGEESWNEKINDPPEDLPPGGGVAAEKFSLSGAILQGLNIALGIGVAVAMTFSLVREWDQLTTAGKIINTLTIITQILTVLLDVVELGATVGAWVVTGTLGVALPIIGAVLAVIGVVLMIVGFFVNLYKSSPPPDPVEHYINDVGKPLISNFDEGPDPQLNYTISPTSVTPGQLTSVEITGKNESGKEVSLTNTRITLLSGTDDTCLFAADDKIKLVEDTDPDKDTENHTYVAPDELADANMSSSKLGTTSVYYQYDVRLAGPKDEKENALDPLVVKANEKVRSVWKAKINKKGADDDHTSSRIDIVEIFKNAQGQNDKSHFQFILRRG
ncbi:hypothetical protein GGS20DRAFT_574537 [Poronia punctata]|nr:hypothetical protein GGS20DRAFT_574537 [Poronia punctata]